MTKNKHWPTKSKKEIELENDIKDMELDEEENVKKKLTELGYMD